MKLTKVQKVTRFIVYTSRDLLLLSMLSGILPAIVAGRVYQILGLQEGDEVLDENQKKLFDDIEVLANFFEEDVITLSQYYEIRSKVVDNYLTKVAEAREE